MHVYTGWIDLRPDRCAAPEVFRAVYELFSTLQNDGYQLHARGHFGDADGYQVTFAIPSVIVLEIYVLPLLEQLGLVDCTEVGYVEEDERGRRSLHILYPAIPHVQRRMQRMSFKEGE